MIQIHGLYWPDDVGLKYKHALKHVKSLEWAIARCRSRRTAVQAGGNVGLWPRRLAEAFDRVITFEPDEVSRQCLYANVPDSVEVRSEALGWTHTTVLLERESLGSHHIGDPATAANCAWAELTYLDALNLDDLDFLQLDVEGYEWFALAGAQETLERCKPLIQVELRDFTKRYGKSDADVRSLLTSLGYREVSQQPGNDVVFEVKL